MTLQLHYSGFEQKYTLDGMPFSPRVYFSKNGETVPDGFNAVCIKLNLGLHSKLKWNEEKKWAEEYVKGGLKLLFEFEMGLFEKIVPDELQLLSLQLGLDQFKDTLQVTFKDHIIGYVVYRGKVMSEDHLDLLKILFTTLPEEIISFLLIEAAEEMLKFLSSDVLEHFHLAIKGEFARNFPYAIPALGWEHGFSPLGFFGNETYEPEKQCRISHAICLPEKRGSFRKIEETLEKIKKPCRLIAPSHLTHAWEGIDTLYVDYDSIGEQTLRKLQGFEAAHGEVVRF